MPSTSLALLLLRDCEEMVRVCYQAIRVSAVHIYDTALAFCPPGSKLRELYAQELPIHVRRGLLPQWSTSCTTFEGHSSDVLSVTYSPTGDRIFSSSTDNTIRLWDTRTGEQLHTFQNDYPTRSLACSPDGSTIISIISGARLRLWDTRNGICVDSHSVQAVITPILTQLCYKYPHWKAIRSPFHLIYWPP